MGMGMGREGMKNWMKEERFAKNRSQDKGDVLPSEIWRLTSYVQAEAADAVIVCQYQQRTLQHKHTHTQLTHRQLQCQVPYNTKMH